MRATTGLLFESDAGRARFLVTAATPPIVVGRRPPYEPHNVRVASVMMSRTHARFTADGSRVLLDDAGSTSGTFVDDARITSAHVVAPGERISFGGETFRARPFTGHSLYELLTGGPRPPCDPRAAAALLRDVLAALAPLHADGAPHGNLDWHHVLREDSGRWITLVDGWTVLDPEGTLSCNPSYCAPEVFAKNVLVPASDLYTLGLLAFEARTGHRPFEPPSQDVQQHLMAKLFGGAPDWRTVGAAQAEQDLYLRLFSLEPAHRPTIDRARALVDELWPTTPPAW
jgi:hypothetical protein